MKVSRQSIRTTLLAAITVIALVGAGTHNRATATAQWTHVATGVFQVLQSDGSGQAVQLVSVRDPYTLAAQALANNPDLGRSPTSDPGIPLPSKPVVPPPDFRAELLAVQIPELANGRGVTTGQWEAHSAALGSETIRYNLFKRDGRTFVVAESQGVFVAAAPDGTKIAAIDSYLHSLYVQDIMTGEIRELTGNSHSTPQGRSMAPIAPRWSPDGSLIYFHSNDNSPRRTSVWSASPDGSNRRVVVDAAAYGDVWLVGFTENGNLLVQGNGAILLVEPTSGVAVASVDAAVALSLSPDGKRFIYQGMVAYGRPPHFVLREVADGNETILTWPSGYVPEGGNPVWSPSGDRFALYLKNPDNPEDRVLAVANLTASPIVTTYPTPSRSLAFNVQSAPTWVGGSGIVVSTIIAKIGNDLAMGKPATWLLKLK